MAEDKMSNDSVSPHDEDCTNEAFKADEVESAKAEMSEVREENARLKTLLEQIENDYKSLQMRFVGICPQQAKKSISHQPSRNEQAGEELELVSLSLGRSQTHQPKIKCNNASSGGSITNIKEDEHLKKDEGLKLGLDFKSFEEYKPDAMELNTDPSPENSAMETKEEETAGDQTWPPSKVLKSIRSEDDDLSQPSVKRARVSVRARCDTPTMNDGCQWRKYGQKIAKGNPCPRAYYRCTVAPSCPVRKQVQRCSTDMSILITTYEGTHNHPLPVSATAMASTTSAAASMLLSGSSSTSQHVLGSSVAPNNLTNNLPGLNISLSETSKTSSYNYLANSSSPPFPTITLDLTTSNPSTSSSPRFSIFPSTNFHSTPRLPSTSLSFSPSQSSVLPTLWANGNLNYGAMSYNKNHIAVSSLQTAGRTPSQEQFYQPFLQKNYQAVPPSQQALTETLTKAITSDPSFRSVIAAAITTMVGGGGAAQLSDNKVENLGKKLKWDEQIRKQQTQPAFSISNGAASATTAENRDQSN